MTDSEQVVFTDWQIGPMLLGYIENAKHQVIIVSPYIEPWPHLKDAIERARQRGVKFTLHFREDQVNKLKEKQVGKLFDKCIPVPILHAKLYFFDDDIVMSSMNLHQYSQQSSKEIAVKLIDPKQKAEVRRYLRERLTLTKPAPGRGMSSETRTEKHSSYGKGTRAPATDVKKQPKASNIFLKAAGSLINALENTLLNDKGFCIRCGTEIDYDPGRPLCHACFQRWHMYGDPDYKEKRCHSCGKESKTSMNKPLCYDCYRELSN